MLLGLFGREKTADHVVLVNLDYRAEGAAPLVGPGNLETFDATAGAWAAVKGSRLELRLPPGGGKLVRVAR